MTTFSRLARFALAGSVAAALVAMPGVAQQAPNTASGLRLPSAPRVFSGKIPSVIKASAIVNGAVITQTDIDHRVALMSALSGEQIPADQLEELRQQVLANLIDEKLQVQAATRDDIKISNAELDRAIKRVADDRKISTDQFIAYLVARGSSLDSVRQQIEGEIAWARLQGRRFEDNAAVREDEVKAVIDKLQKSKGDKEYRVSEIYLTANASNKPAVAAKAEQIMAALRQGQAFVGYARQYSEASTASVGGDLGWVRPEMLPPPLDKMLAQMEPGTISPPVEVPGGISILALSDTRQILVADPRQAVLNLKQVTVPIAKGMAPAAINALIERFGKAAQSLGGCGNTDKLAASFGGDVVQSDNVAMRDLPGPVQELVVNLQIGQATVPFGSVEEGARVLVLCGRDQPQVRVPTYDEIFSQLSEERVNLKARRFLRDLRRDAIIEYR